jgi:Big-like domain-containing protein
MAVEEFQISFQQGVAGYVGTLDTQLSQGQPDTSFAAATQITVDRSPDRQVLLRFEDLFGAGHIPLGATIVSATLTLQTTNAGNGATLHRMLTPWAETATWNSLVGGVSTNGVEALATADLTTGTQRIGVGTFDVTASVQAWANGAANYGWVFKSLGTDGWGFLSSEGSVSPKLTVKYTVATGPNTAPDAVADSATVTAGASVAISVLANDGDADGNTLSVTATTAPAHGSVQVGASGVITYSPASGYTGSDSFTYTISDGRGGTDTASVTVNVKPAQVVYEAQFAQGAAGYAGVVDTQLSQGQPDTSFANSTQITVDRSPDRQVLLRFEDLFGAGHIPLGATIVSATLTLQTTNAGNGATLHRMLTPWAETATWNSLLGGVSTNGVEALATADLGTGTQRIGIGTFDVTASVQAWANGAANYGWVFKSLGTDGWGFLSSEGSVSPKLTVKYTVATGPNTAPDAVADSATVTAGASVAISVLANDSDADGNALSVTATTAPAHGSVQVGANGVITYSPAQGYTGSDSFTYTISDGRGGSDTTTVTLSVRPQTGVRFDGANSYVAIENGAGSTNNMEHTNASKSFFHDGTWWAVLPGAVPGQGNVWAVYQFTETLPNAGASGGLNLASAPLLSSGLHADVAWNDATDTLYVLQYGSSTAHPFLFQMAYNAGSRSWSTTAAVDLGAKLDPAYWGSHNDLALGLDQYGNPLLLSVTGGSATKGLHLAYATSPDLSQWQFTTLDSDTTKSGGTNGDSKADFITFSQGGVEKIGVIYSKDGAASNSWNIIWHDAASNTAQYAGQWSSEVVTRDISIDDHMSAVSDGTHVYAAIKDANNSIWLLQGTPGNWQDPVLVVNGSAHDPSRPIITLDETNGLIYIMYQEKMSPFGDIYMKVADASHPVFDGASIGTKIIDGTSSSDRFFDPQGPAHTVGAETDNYFLVFAKDAETSEIWYNGINLPSSASDPFLSLA